MDKSLEKYRSLYVLVKDETKKDLFGPAGFFGPLGTDHKALKIFADWIKEKKKENGGVLTQNQINSHTFIEELEKKSENKDLVAKIKGLHLIQTEQIQNNTLFRFAKVIKALGMVEQEGKSIGLYEEALKKIASMQPLQAQKNVAKVEPKTSVKTQKKGVQTSPVPAKVSSTIGFSATATGSTTDAAIPSAPAVPTSGTITPTNTAPTTPTATASAAVPVVSSTPATPSTDTSTTTSTSTSTSTSTPVVATIESEKTTTVQQQDENKDATFTPNITEPSANPATPEAKKTEIPHLKSTLDISGKKVEVPGESSLPKTLKITTMGSEEAAIDNDRIRNNVNTMGGLLSIPRAPTRSPGIQGIPLPSQNRKVHRLHGNRRMKAPAKRRDPLKIQDAKPVNRKAPVTQAQQAQQAQTRGLEDQEYNEQVRRNAFDQQEAQQEGGQSKSSKLKKALIGGGIGSALAGGGFFSSIIIPDEETTAFGANFIATHTVTTFKSIISIIHLFLK